MWFASPPGYYANHTRAEARAQLASLERFSRLLGSFPKASWPTSAAGADVHPVWGHAAPAVAGYAKLARLLVEEEVKRVRVWNDPLGDANAGAAPPAAAPWAELVPLAWQVDPRLALALRDRFPSLEGVRRGLEALVVAHAAEPRVQREPAAALLLAVARPPPRGPPLLPLLAAWAPGDAAEGLQLLCGPAAREPAVRSYAIKCLLNERPEKVVFYLPQLVQLLRGDDGAVAGFFAAAAAASDLFCHQLIWALASEARPPEEAFDPEVKRSGWQPPKDTGLWEVSQAVRRQIEAGMTREQREYWEAQGGYFDKVTSLSGYLYKFSKDERRLRLVEALKKFSPPRDDLYMPTNPDARVLGHIPESGACMQSAAKARPRALSLIARPGWDGRGASGRDSCCAHGKAAPLVPILVAFNVERPQLVEGAAAAAALAAPSGGGGGEGGDGGPAMVRSKLACIFKVGDDVRQDVVALQVITLLHAAYKRAGLGLYLRPYGCLPTGYECGIIECVPNCKSRAALGELSDRPATGL
ncbi:phosphatidylinositol 4-kinase [Monoraphidium neglectum]|uniref:1-phosphatidylinositol 4-kinase n=1 Tax=Monoraphidium neglectum TaxID=145388 RepID=A0A0D2J2T4_9CHLO|nr:phosphatidylinositol 4-kinase [Monoraphidium neglectum]KIY94287.1 phosphatidylinositol 4-kinase [Monoraphidium neglectum]|eukprot:XP_013893307.1 phosphatidylinositol 4-kinase [Monoraphidium neglectum]